VAGPAPATFGPTPAWAQDEADAHHRISEIQGRIVELTRELEILKHEEAEAPTAEPGRPTADPTSIDRHPSREPGPAHGA
jgi:hypothetical protein